MVPHDIRQQMIDGHSICTCTCGNSTIVPDLSQKPTTILGSPNASSCRYWTITASAVCTWSKSKRRLASSRSCCRAACATMGWYSICAFSTSCRPIRSKAERWRSSRYYRSSPATISIFQASSWRTQSRNIEDEMPENDFLAFLDDLFLIDFCVALLYLLCFCGWEGLSFGLDWSAALLATTTGPWWSIRTGIYRELSQGLL